MTISDKAAIIKQLVLFILDLFPKIVSIVQELIALVKDVQNA